jgi:serine/threonine-protein kinase
MPPAPPFQLLERYDVIEEIGRGGHAVVYKAYDRSLSRDVAVKLLRDDVLTPDVRLRFAQEVQVLATLQHPHILHVHDSGTFAGRPFAVMELAPAQSLAHRLERERQLPLLDAVQIVREIASALSHAHARGVLHRDVKPENILLGPGGAILADFGIARLTGDIDISRITSTGEAVGTLQYMSPEQLCAEAVDARSDQYALACVFYEMLAGVRPHTAATFEGLRALRLTGQQPPVSVYRPAVTPALEEIIARAMAVNAADRFRSMDELLMAVDLARTGEMVAGSDSHGHTRVTTGPASARVESTQVEIKQTIGRMPLAIGAVALVAAAVWAIAKPPTAPLQAASDGMMTVAVAANGSDTLTALLRARLMTELSAWPEVEVHPAPSSRTMLSVGASAVPLGDSVQLRIDARVPSTDASRSTSARRVIHVVAPEALRNGSPLYAELARELLAGRAPKDVPGLEQLSTRSLRVLRLYVQAFDALRRGALDSAVQDFRRVTDAEPTFAPARFWSAQTMAWRMPRAVDTWRADADALQPGESGTLEALLGTALQQLARRAYPEACATYRAATVRDASSFVAWWGLGECQRLDDVVLSSSRGRYYRSSHWSALKAYRAAAPLVRWPGLQAALHTNITQDLYVNGTRARPGRDAASGARVYALPSLDADTLAFIPVDSATFLSGGPRSVPDSWVAAVRRARDVAIDMSRVLFSRFPDAPEIALQHAVLLEVAGRTDSRESALADSALRKLADAPLAADLLARIAVARTRLALRHGDVGTAVSLATTAIARAHDGSGRADSLLAPLAAFAGDRARLTAFYLMDLEAVALPDLVRDTLRAAQVAVLLASCADAKRYIDVVDGLLPRQVPTPALPALRERWMTPLYRAAVPCLGPAVMTSVRSTFPLDAVIRALAQGDSASARVQLARIRQGRRGATNASLSWDYQYLESWTTLRAGDTTQAVLQLVSALDDLAGMSMSTFEQPAQAAGLRHSLLLLRQIGARVRVPATSSLGTWQSKASLLPNQ